MFWRDYNGVTPTRVIFRRVSWILSLRFLLFTVGNILCVYLYLWPEKIIEQLISIEEPSYGPNMDYEYISWSDSNGVIPIQGILQTRICY